MFEILPPRICASGSSLGCQSAWNTIPPSPRKLSSRFPPESAGHAGDHDALPRAAHALASLLSSVALESRTLLGDEGAIGAAVVTCLHTDGLGLRLRLDRVIDAHAPFLMDAALGHRVREGRTVG